MVQEGNYLSQSRHIWQGDTPEIPTHMVRVAVPAEWDHPQIGSRGESTLASRGVKQNSHVPPIGSWANSQEPMGGPMNYLAHQKTQKGRLNNFQGITEAGSRPLLR